MLKYINVYFCSNNIFYYFYNLFLQSTQTKKTKRVNYVKNILK